MQEDYVNMQDNYVSMQVTNQDTYDTPNWLKWDFHSFRVDKLGLTVVKYSLRTENYS